MGRAAPRGAKGVSRRCRAYRSACRYVVPARGTERAPAVAADPGAQIAVVEARLDPRAEGHVALTSLHDADQAAVLIATLRLRREHEAVGHRRLAVAAGEGRSQRERAIEVVALA